MTSREAFEAWISRPPFECSVARWPDDPDKTAWPGNYKKLDVQLAWCAWQDSRAYALAEAATPVLLEALQELADYVDERSGDNECRPLENARYAIRKATGVEE